MATYKQADYEALRRRCVELKQAGWKQADIARAFGLTQGWVSQTLKIHREQGDAGLTTGKRTGAPSRLTADQLDRLTKELAKGLSSMASQAKSGPGHGLMNRAAGAVITKLFGVSYDPSQVGRLLKKVGWSRQKPTRQARQQDPQAVANWREERLPALKESQS